MTISCVKIVCPSSHIHILDTAKEINRIIRDGQAEKLVVSWSGAPRTVEWSPLEAPRLGGKVYMTRQR